ncbi:ABC-three component system protein [Rhizobium sp. 007]|uniref:ABC-three component system protein n=1 Tax=Rhizobium sp. 007 TaxID=2785056 RepID=UPI00188E2794|nr:ABC-three component system protein [Rhizobium sp. 007]QPB18577.1 hypothetical protein ISN39_12990 [Rhizobium sp. 007]
MSELQQRGGAGDKGRDIVVWFGEPGASDRYWHLYQCKRYSSALGEASALAEIGKVLYFASQGDFTLPREYWFVTRKGVTNGLQDLLDDPEKLKKTLVETWVKNCETTITTKHKVPLDDSLLALINGPEFPIVRAKQHLELIKEHGQTAYHLVVFGKPLIERPKPSAPPSSIAEKERSYVRQLFEVIEEMTGSPIQQESDFKGQQKPAHLFERSRASFYSAEGLKELARDQMDQVEFFDDLLGQFRTGLYYTYTAPAASGHERIRSTVQAAQVQQVDGHVLGPHLTAFDREGICHHLANDESLTWCDHD